MLSLEERIADRKARGKELAEQAAGDRKPTKEEIELATTQTLVVPVQGDVADALKGKGAGGNKAPEWKSNA